MKCRKILDRHTEVAHILLIMVKRQRSVGKSKETMLAHFASGLLMV